MKDRCNITASADTEKKRTNQPPLGETGRIISTTSDLLTDVLQQFDQKVKCLLMFVSLWGVWRWILTYSSCSIHRRKAKLSKLLIRSMEEHEPPTPSTKTVKHLSPITNLPSSIRRETKQHEEWPTCVHECVCASWASSVKWPLRESLSLPAKKPGWAIYKEL